MIQVVSPNEKNYQKVGIVRELKDGVAKVVFFHEYQDENLPTLTVESLQVYETIYTKDICVAPIPKWDDFLNLEFKTMSDDEDSLGDGVELSKGSDEEKKEPTVGLK